MFFKQLALLSILLGVVVSLSCSSENDPSHEAVTIDIRDKERNAEINLDCIENFSDFVSLYFNSQATERDVIEFWACTSRVVELYRDYSPLTYKRQARYPVEGVRQFLEKYFIKEGLSLDLIEQVMELKVVLFGGEVDHFTDREFKKLQGFITEELSPIFLELRPHISVLTSGTLEPKKTNLKSAELNLGIQKLRQAMWRLGSSFSKQQKNYSFGSLLKLFDSLKPLSENSWVQKLPLLVPALRETKALLVGPNRDVIYANEWPAFYDMLATAYGIWLRAVNFLAEKDITQNSALDQFSLLVEDVLNSVKFGLSRRRSSIYENEEARKLFQAMEPVSGIPFDLDLETLSTGWNFLVDKALESSLMADDSKQSGLTILKVERARDQFRKWVSVQKYMNETLGKDFSSASDQLLGLKKVLSGLDFNLEIDSKGRLKVPFESKESEYSLSALKQLNLARALVDLLFQAYTSERLRLNKSDFINFEELSRFVEDFKPLATVLGLLDPEDKTFANRVFRDTSLFVPSSNGDLKVDYEEAVEYVYYLLSGFNANQWMLESLRASCPSGVNEQEGSFSSTCVNQFLKDDDNAHLTHLPLLQAYMQKIEGTSRWENLLFYLRSTVSGQIEAQREWVKKGDLFEMQVLMLYIETFVYRFDLNKDEVLNVSEINQFIEKFIIPIGFLTPYDPEYHKDEIKGFFTYIMKFKRSPLDTTDKGASLRFDYWKRVPERWRFSAEREHLGITLSILANL